QEGYGTTNYSHNGHWRIVLVHRLVYVRLVADPAALPVDHRCHDPATCRALPNDCPHRRCMNPGHLAAVTHAANIARGGGVSAMNAAKTRCDSGHEFTTENTYLRQTGGRGCKECARLRMLASRAAKRAGDEALAQKKALRAAVAERIAIHLIS